MKIKEIKKIVNIIISTEWTGRIKVDDLILKISLNKADIDFDKDYLMDEVGDPKTKSYEKLISVLKITLNDNSKFKKFELFDELDGFYIEKIHSDIKIDNKFNEVVKFINKIESIKNKGIVFENFCRKFLVDLGVVCSLTKTSNDKGIDILGEFSVNFTEQKTNLIFNENIYLLIQTKYFSTPIDTPVIRKLVGDSLFIRFDELEYVQIRHNAFHLIVFSHNGFTEPAKEFSKKNKIKLFDSQQIAHIISESPEKKWSCLNPLE
jgi:hypothetical protein